MCIKLVSGDVHLFSPTTEVQGISSDETLNFRISEIMQSESHLGTNDNVPLLFFSMEGYNFFI